MAVLRNHLAYYIEIFQLPGILQSPALMFGFQELQGFYPPLMQDWRDLPLGRKIKNLGLLLIEKTKVWRGLRHPCLDIPAAWREQDLVHVFRNLGLADVEVLDLYDSRAQLHHDMNHPVPGACDGRYGLVIDVGSTEHVFDTRQCLDNLFRMTRVGGHLVMHLPCNGYFDHGFHTFSPECILSALELNGFRIVYRKFSTRQGAEIRNPDGICREPGEYRSGYLSNIWKSLELCRGERNTSAIMWVAAQKQTRMPEFVIPQQGRWKDMYTSDKE